MHLASQRTSRGSRPNKMHTVFRRVSRCVGSCSQRSCHTPDRASYCRQCRAHQSSAAVPLPWCCSRQALSIFDRGHYSDDGVIVVASLFGSSSTRWIWPSRRSGRLDANGVSCSCPEGHSESEMRPRSSRMGQSGRASPRQCTASSERVARIDCSSWILASSSAIWLSARRLTSLLARR